MHFQEKFNHASVYAFTQNIKHSYMHSSKEQNQFSCIQHAFSFKKREIKFHAFQQIRILTKHIKPNFSKEYLER